MMYSEEPAGEKEKKFTEFGGMWLVIVCVIWLIGFQVKTSRHHLSLSFSSWIKYVPRIVGLLVLRLLSLQRDDLIRLFDRGVRC